MTNSEKTKTNNEKQYFIPMEVTDETIVDFNIDPEEVVWAKIGNNRVRVIMVPATEEQYREYMRPLWRENKRMQRHGNETSLDELYEDTEYEKADEYSLEDDVFKKELISELHKALDGLEEIDRIIMEMYSQKCSETEIGQAVGMSQKGINKRKHKIFENLKTKLKNFR